VEKSNLKGRATRPDEMVFKWDKRAIAQQQ
jgi:hypothetical protein